MELLRYQMELGDFLSLSQSIEQELLLERIKKQHREILNKLLPEIDMHFSAVIEQKNYFFSKLRSAYEAFCRFSELLKDHSYMEEHIVFPELALEEKPMIAAIRDFILNHDDFEAMIQELLLNIRFTLQPLLELLPFRILLLKMEHLQLLLSEHNTLENLLFSDFLFEE